MSTDPTIIYTLTDEAPRWRPAPSCRSSAPSPRRPAFVSRTSDISVAARILGNFPDA